MGLYGWERYTRIARGLAVAARQTGLCRRRPAARRQSAPRLSKPHPAEHRLDPDRLNDPDLPRDHPDGKQPLLPRPRRQPPMTASATWSAMAANIITRAPLDHAEPAGGHHADHALHQHRRRLAARQARSDLVARKPRHSPYSLPRTQTHPTRRCPDRRPGAGLLMRSPQPAAPAWHRAPPHHLVDLGPGRPPSIGVDVDRPSWPGRLCDWRVSSSGSCFALAGPIPSTSWGSTPRPPRRRGGPPAYPRGRDHEVDLIEESCKDRRRRSSRWCSTSAVWTTTSATTRLRTS